ncbi:MAG: transposase [Desulfofustis sp. PB-SRB1]|nr:transposase [Desulfofustis sp. PB-SRB1]
MAASTHLGWYKHGKLPHYDCPDLYQAITYRLADSLPSSVFASLQSEPEKRNTSQAQLNASRRIHCEEMLDTCHGSCILRQHHNATLVLDGWHYFDEKRYDLVIGVVMPNHVHVLIRMYPESLLGATVKTWKNYAARRFTNEIVPGLIPHWQAGYWDRFIRNEKHLHDVVEYIVFNPVKARLVELPEQWPYFAIGKTAGLVTGPPGGAIS